MTEDRAGALYAPAAWAALAAFGVRAEAVELVSVSENVTFRVASPDADGCGYVLRLHRPGYHTLEELHAERTWTRALAEAGLGVPIAVTRPNGEDYVSVDVAGTGETRYAGLALWTEGALLADVLAADGGDAQAEVQIERLGAVVAGLHNQASGWTPPPGFARHRLDADGLMAAAPFWGPFWDHPALDPGERALFLATREAIHAALTRLGEDPHRFSMIHADLHPGNVLVTADGLTVFDFDDAGFGWHLYDAAVALSAWRDSPRLEAMASGFWRGYRRVRDLSSADETLLPMFMLARGLATIGWLAGRPELNGPRHVAGFETLRAWTLARCAAFEPPC